MSETVEIIVSVFVLLAGFFTLAGAIGLYRLPDLMTRLHAPTLSVTLGVGFAICATLTWFSFKEHSLQLHELVITLLLLFSAPVSAHMIGKAALHRKVSMTPNTQAIELAEPAREQRSPDTSPSENDTP